MSDGYDIPIGSCPSYTEIVMESAIVLGPTEAGAANI